MDDGAIRPRAAYRIERQVDEQASLFAERLQLRGGGEFCLGASRPSAADPVQEAHQRGVIPQLRGVGIEDANGQTFRRAQVIDQCQAMARMHRRRRASSAPLL